MIIGLNANYPTFALKQTLNPLVKMTETRLHDCLHAGPGDDEVGTNEGHARPYLAHLGPLPAMSGRPRSHFGFPLPRAHASWLSYYAAYKLARAAAVLWLKMGN